MVTQQYDKRMRTFYLRSDDTKPTGVENGTRIIEVDTGDEYRFDAENSTWHNIQRGSGGGTPEQTITTDGTPPLSFESNGTAASAYSISGDMSQTGTPSTSTPVYPQEVGDFVESGDNSGDYAIGVEIGSTTKTIYLTEPIRKIGSYNDEILYTPNQQMVIRFIRKIVLDGTEDYLRYNSTTPRCYLEIPGAVYTDGAVTVYCSHYQARANGSLTNVVGYPSGSIAWRTVLNQLTIIDENIQSIDDFKQFLAGQYANGTPVCIWYITEMAVVEYTQFPELVPFTGNNTLVFDTTLQPSYVSITCVC